eukprot:GGOE01018556.1.p1 GENE.GGOE01018556.1~~GGOE01018556.1.p1  ORF type:complete len:332 (+),score=67.90 GGOE01018556.1:422-1417(+)
MLHNARCRVVDFVEGQSLDHPVLPDYANSALATLVPQHISASRPMAAPSPTTFNTSASVRISHGLPLKRTTKERKGSLLVKEITKKHQEKARAFTGIALKCSAFGLQPRGVSRISSIKPILKRPKPESDSKSLVHPALGWPATAASPPLPKRTKLSLGALATFRSKPPPPSAPAPPCATQPEGAAPPVSAVIPFKEHSPPAVPAMPHPAPPPRLPMELRQCHASSCVLLAPQSVLAEGTEMPSRKCIAQRLQQHCGTLIDPLCATLLHTAAELKVKNFLAACIEAAELRSDPSTRWLVMPEDMQLAADFRPDLLTGCEAVQDRIDAMQGTG